MPDARAPQLRPRRRHQPEIRSFHQENLMPDIAIDPVRPRQVTPLPAAPVPLPSETTIAPVVNQVSQPAPRPSLLSQIQGQVKSLEDTVRRLEGSTAGPATLQSLSRQLDNVRSALDGLQGNSSNARATPKQVERLLAQLAELTARIAEMVKKLGGEPVTAPGTGGNTETTQPQTATTPTGDNGAGAKKGKGLDVGAVVKTGLELVGGPIGSLIGKLF
jgi:hypothetical protein